MLYQERLILSIFYETREGEILMNAYEATEITKSGMLEVEKRCDKWERKIFKRIEKAAKKGREKVSIHFRSEYDIDVDILGIRLEKLGYNVKAYVWNSGRLELEIEWDYSVSHDKEKERN